MTRTPLAMGALIAALGISAPATAAIQIRVSDQSAVNNCQAASPGVEDAFRKRPLGIANVSGDTAHISCGLWTETPRGLVTTSDVFVRFTNRSAVPVNVSCTLVNGFAPEIPNNIGPPTFFPKNRGIPAGQSGGLVWSQVENGNVAFLLPNLSCAIPPGVEINATQTVYTADVGA